MGFLWYEEPLRIPDRPFPIQSYHHLSLTTPIALASHSSPTRILHVTKEFGPATLGGLGVMLTSLSIAQSTSPHLDISIALPYYSFLRPPSDAVAEETFAKNRTVEGEIGMRKYTTLNLGIKDKKGRETKVRCQVDILKWRYRDVSIEDFLDNPTSSQSPAFPDGLDGSINSTLKEIDIFLIGPGDSTPFDVAFKVNSAQDVYSSQKPLKQEWKDLWFAKGVSELVAHLSYTTSETLFVEDDEEDFFEDDDEEENPTHLFTVKKDEPSPDVVPTSAAAPPVAIQLPRPVPPKGVDIVHLHGATNALVAFFLRSMETNYDIFGERHAPAIVYTLHDSLDEVEYSNLVSNLYPFAPPESYSPASTSTSLPHSPTLENRHHQIPSLQPYIHGKQLFTSALGIDFSDMTTFVSRPIAASLIEGRFPRFPLQSLVMPSLAARHVQHSFFGISNGIDLSNPSTNPFTNPTLKRYHLAFPNVGPNLTDPKTLWTSSVLSAGHGGGSESGPADAGGRGSVSFSQAKARAKEFLIESLPTLFVSEDMDRPWFLFVGRFQYNKGCQFFEPLVDFLASSDDEDASTDAIPINARLIVLGQRNNYPHSSLLKLARQHPLHFTLIDDPAFQPEWGAVLRMASDFAFVPSFSEAFGLVAVEGLLFGMGVVSTGVGGMGEFLKPVGGPAQDSLAGSREGEEKNSGRAWEPSPTKVTVQKGNAYLFELEDGAPPGEEVGIAQEAKEVRKNMNELKGAVGRMKVKVAEAVRDWKVRRDEEKTGWKEREMWLRGMVLDGLALRWGREDGPIDEYVRVYDLALAAKAKRLQQHRAFITDPDDPTTNGTPPSDSSTPLVLSGEDTLLGPVPALPIYKVWTSESVYPKKRKKVRAKRQDQRQRDAPKEVG